jgi:hypothetical protein
MPSNDGDRGGCTGGSEAAASTGGEGGEGTEAAQPRLHPRDQVWQRLPGQNRRRGYLPTRAAASALVPLLAVEVASGSATDPLHFPD